jgi:regulator of protease activity HflC (stomatin/prohibitin superfamily)
VFDLIAQGERKEEYDNLTGAIALYQEAKEKAAALYFMDGKKEALELQMAAEETLEKEQLAAEKRLQEQIEAEAVSRALDQDQKTNDQQNAINMENQGNELLAQGSYESAIPSSSSQFTVYSGSSSLNTRRNFSFCRIGANS